MESTQREEHVRLPSKGGSQTIPFIIANEGCERIVNAAISANIIIYLTKEYKMGSATSALVLFAYQAAASFLPILGAVVSDTLLGRFLTITLALFAYTIGTALLWLTTMVPKLVAGDCGNGHQSCHSPTTFQLVVLFSSFAFLSIGSSGIRPCSLAFGVDQFAPYNGAQKDRALKVLFSWYYISMGGSNFISITLLVYLQDKFGWKIGFAVPLAIMALVTILNIVASPLYIKVKPQKSSWASLFQVLYVAIKNRHIEIPEACDGVQYHHNPRESALFPSSKLRFLNKACLLQTRADNSNTEVFNANRGSICTVEQVEDLKSTLSVIPIWSAMITCALIQQGQSFRVLQADTMDRHVGITKFKIPAGSIAVFEVITFMLLSGCYDRYIIPFLQKITGREIVLTPMKKMGIGLMFSISSALTASVVEAFRRKQAIKQGLQEADGTVNMSALWLAPQSIFSGLTGAFGSVGQIEFYYAVLPKTMGSLALALMFLATGIANIEATIIVKVVKAVTGRGGRVSWLPDNLNHGHYDYYYFLLALQGVINFIYFLFCSYWFEEPKQIVESSED
ncbi:hypothetical protein EJB05_28190, partial [Eragrostis curvula]